MISFCVCLYICQRFPPQSIFPSLAHPALTPLSLLAAKLNGTVMKGVLDDVKLKAGILYEKVGPMMPETMDILNDFYEPFMENLADILQDERFLWRDMEIP